MDTNGTIKDNKRLQLQLRNAGLLHDFTAGAMATASPLDPPGSSPRGAKEAFDRALELIRLLAAEGTDRVPNKFSWAPKKFRIRHEQEFSTIFATGTAN